MVFGGPLGVRNLVFVVSRMHQNIELAKQHESPPADIIQLVRGPRRVWSASDAHQELDSCIAALRTDIARSRTILQVTYPDRLLAWRTAIFHSAEKLTGLERASQSEIGVTATSGIPRTANLIKEMYEEIVADLHEESHVQETVSRLVDLRVDDRGALPVDDRLGSRTNTHNEPGNLSGM
jgi:hypothetical protein